MANPDNPKKKKKSGAWGLAVIILIWLINTIDFDAVSRFFRRLRWTFRTGSFGPDDGAAVAAIVAVVVLVVVITAVAAAAKRAKARRFDGVRAQRGGTAEHHSHDRLQGYAGNESAAEHWKKQLDGFLAAGIIDRSEYRTLLERRMK